MLTRVEQIVTAAHRALQSCTASPYRALLADFVGVCHADYQWSCACVQEYYAAQCTNTKLNYEKKQLERKRDQLLSQWRTHDAVTCRRPSSPLMSDSMTTSAPTFGFLPPPSLSVLSPVASGSTPVEVLGGDAPVDDDNTDESDDEEDNEEQMEIFDSLLMQDLTDNMYDPLSRSLSCPAASCTDSECASLTGFVDQDVPAFSIFNEPASPAPRTAAAATEGQEMDPIPKRPAPLADMQGRRPESSSTRTAARSRSFPFTYAEPAHCSPETKTRSRSDTDWTVASSQATSNSTTRQSPVANIPLHVRTLSSDSDDEDNR